MTITPEAEVLDRLLDGPMPLAAVRHLFNPEATFRRSLLAMLYAGDVRLLNGERKEVRWWEWQTVFDDPSQWSAHTLSITEQGAKRV